jgi:hypothetical protein
MNEEQKGGSMNCNDVRYVRDDKTLTGAVCVVLNREIGKRARKVDIIFMDEKKGAWSVRSTTELMNVIMKWKVPFEERKRVLDFVAERLRTLAASFISYRHIRTKGYGSTALSQTPTSVYETRSSAPTSKRAPVR